MTVTYTFNSYAGMTAYCLHITDFYFRCQVDVDAILCSGDFVHDSQVGMDAVLYVLGCMCN